jgi:leader peptidase (prepilin peptidase)/N-methyltransferase
VVVALAVLGALLGALVPPVAYRLSVPYGQPRRTACATCGAPLRKALRCKKCGARLGPPVWLTAGIGALVFGSLGWALGPVRVLPAFLAVAALGLLLGAIDVACHRLPDPLVALGFALAAGGVLVTGEWHAVIRAGEAAVVMFAGYLVLALLPRANLGFGDVKLAGLLGLLLGWLGWPAVLLGALLPHLLNGPVAVVLLLSRKVRRDTEIPLGPALLAGAWLAVVVYSATR